jgi:transposase
MPQALKLMNIQWSEGLSDITGVTGQAILRAIVAGERDPVQLAQWRNPACTSSPDQLAKALTGTWREEQLFMLKQAVELYTDDTAKSRECEAPIERQLAAMKPRFESDAPPPTLPPVKPGSTSKISLRTTCGRI